MNWMRLRGRSFAGSEGGKIRLSRWSESASRGLDLPEVSLVAILDADKEVSFVVKPVWSRRLVARECKFKVILYADKVTDSMKLAIDETEASLNPASFNDENGIRRNSTQEDQSVH